MEKINNWEEVEAKGMEDFKPLPIGAYECIIKDARINKNEENGKETLKISVDIAKGDYKDYFQDRFNKNTNEDKKWDNNACKYLAFQGDNTAYFKGFITCVENSNPGYKWDWNESALAGKKVCGVFQYEEYEKQDGSKGIKVRLNKFRSLDKINEIEVSDSIKLLNGKFVGYDDYTESKEENSMNPFDGMEDSIQITNDILD